MLWRAGASFGGTGPNHYAMVLHPDGDPGTIVRKRCTDPRLTPLLEAYLDMWAAAYEGDLPLVIEGAGVEEIWKASVDWSQEFREKENLAAAIILES